MWKDFVSLQRGDAKLLCKDAERYRWLLAHTVVENDDGEKCVHYPCDFEHYDNVSASIDAAMLKTPNVK
jgi:hypothetical protein